jgi:hypothetical protein
VSDPSDGANRVRREPPLLLEPGAEARDADPVVVHRLPGEVVLRLDPSEPLPNEVGRDLTELPHVVEEALEAHARLVRVLLRAAPANELLHVLVHEIVRRAPLHHLLAGLAALHGPEDLVGGCLRGATVGLLEVDAIPLPVVAVLEPPVLGPALLAVLLPLGSVEPHGSSFAGAHEGVMCAGDQPKPDLNSWRLAPARRYRLPAWT